MISGRPHPELKRRSRTIPGRRTRRRLELQRSGWYSVPVWGMSSPYGQRSSHRASFARIDQRGPGRDIREMLAGPRYESACRVHFRSHAISTFIQMNWPLGARAALANNLRTEPLVWLLKVENCRLPVKPQFLLLSEKSLSMILGSTGLECAI